MRDLLILFIGALMGGLTVHLCWKTAFDRYRRQKAKNAEIMNRYSSIADKIAALERGY